MPLSEKEIADILAAGKSPRARSIETYQRYFDGTIYEGRPGFLDMTSKVPLTERAPCVVYPAVRNAVGSFSSMCLGEGRFPVITSMTSEDDSTFDPRFGLNPDDSADLDAGITKIVEQTRLQVVAQQLLEAAMAAGTAVPIVSVVKGRLKVSQIDPKCCTPEFAPDDPETVTALEVSYRYVVDEFSTADRKWIKKVKQYRRRIDATTDTVFVPLDVLTVEQFPTPSVPQSSYVHNFGFCPVVWYRALTPVADIGAIDGRPVHWGLLSLCDAINFTLSQRFRAALYCGDPQIVETGVTEDGVIAPMGRASTARQMGSDASGFGLPLQPGRSGGYSVRQKGPGTVWRYESADAKVQMLTLPGDALKSIETDAADNIKKLREALGHVHIDPETLTGSGDISGKTLAFVFATQIAKCNRIREDFGKKCLLPVLNMLFRVVLSSGKGLYLAGATKLQSILPRFQQQVGTTSVGVTWFEPTLKLKWGEYFEPSDVDEATRSDTARNDYNAGLITLATAVGHIRPAYNDITNIDQYLQTLQDEADAKQQRAMQNAAAMKTATGADPNAPAGASSTATPASNAARPAGVASAKRTNGNPNATPGAKTGKQVANK